MNPTYDQPLLVKLALVGLSLLSAALERVSLAREALVLVAVLGVTAILSTAAPPGGHDTHASAATEHDHGQAGGTDIPWCGVNREATRLFPLAALVVRTGSTVRPVRKIGRFRDVPAASSVTLRLCCSSSTPR